MSGCMEGWRKGVMAGGMDEEWQDGGIMRGRYEWINDGRDRWQGGIAGRRVD